MFSSNEFEVQIAHSVEEIGPEAWDYLAANQPFASYRWYRFGETVLADNIPVYIILSRKGEPVARATFWLTQQEQLPIASGPMRWMMNALIHRWPLLICRAPLANMQALILPSSPWRGPALSTIAQIALEQAQLAHTSFMFFDYLGQENLEWPKAFTLFSFADPGTSLNITWPDFDSYLRHLNKSARKSYKKNFRHANDLGIRVGYHSTVDKALLDKAIALIRNVDHRHGESHNPWARRLLENIGLADAVWLTAEINDQLVGCELILRDGDTCVSTALGLDYSVQYTYFVLGYAGIRYAIEHGARRLRWGSGAYEFKLRMGFELENNNYIVFAANSPVLRWAVRYLSPS